MERKWWSGRSLKKTWRFGMAAAMVFLAAGVAAVAANEWTEEKNRGMEIVPYLWFVGVRSDVSVRGNDSTVDVGFGDIWDALDFGGSVAVLGHVNRVVFGLQTDYLALDSDNLEDAPPNARMEMDTFLLEASVGYRFDHPNMKSNLAVLLGGRWSQFDTHLSIFNQEADKVSNLFDPMVMLRPHLSLTDRFAFNFPMGIGAGGDSDLIYELNPQFLFLMTRHVNVRLGYRYLYYRFENDPDHAFDGAFQGPTLGIGARF